MTSKMLIRPLAVLCTLPPLLQVFFWQESSSAHNIATFLTGLNDWRINPVTTIAGMLAVCFVLLTEATIKIGIRLMATVTTNSNSAGRNSNPIKKMIVIQGITALFFTFLHKTLMNVEAQWLVFPRLLLGIPSTLNFILFFLLSDGAPTSGEKYLAGSSTWRR